MPDLAAALDAALHARYAPTGIRTPVTQRRGLTARMNALAKQFTHPGDRKGQGDTRAAKAAGIGASTWRHWRAGTRTPSARMLAKLEASYKRVILDPKLKTRVNSMPPPDRVTVGAHITWRGYKNRQWWRTVKLTGMANVMVHTIRAWVREGPDAAAEVFERGTADKEQVPADPGIQFGGDEVEIDFP